MHIYHPVQSINFGTFSLVPQPPGNRSTETDTQGG